MSQEIKDFAAGVISGWTQVLIMQPFEIIKVRLQTQNSLKPEYQGIADCLKKTVKQEGLAALYKGTLSPLIGVGFQVSVQFGLNELCKRYFQRFKTDLEFLLPMPYVAASGFVAGVGSGLVATPIQHARIRIQVQKGDSKLYSGSIDAAKKILSTYGIKGLYSGLIACVIRESLGSTLYFTGYEFTLRQFLKPGQRPSEAPLSASLIAGGVAGLSFWIFLYPIDFIKTTIQTDSLSNPKYRGILDVFSKTMKQGGIKTFYKGYLVCLMRAVPVNSGGFLAFQTALRAFGRNE